MIDFNKPVQTLRGEKVRILCTDARSECPVMGLIERKPGSDDHWSWCADGKSFNDGRENQSDLINVPERVERWLCIVDDVWHEYKVKQLAFDKPVTPQIRITYQDGRIVDAALEDCK